MDASQAPEKSEALELLLATQRRRMQLRREMAAAKREAAEQQKAEAAAAEAGIEAPLPWWQVDCPPNMVTAQTPADVAAALASAPPSRLVALGFFSPECYACRSMQPKLRQIARDRGASLLLVKVNCAADGLREYCDERGVTKIPYFRLYRGGELVSEFTANMQPDKLKLLRGQIDGQIELLQGGDAAGGSCGGGAAAGGGEAESI